MTFMAKEATGMWEREAEAPPCKGQQFWGETCWVQARFRCETSGQSHALSEPWFPISHTITWTRWSFPPLR